MRKLQSLLGEREGERMGGREGEGEGGMKRKIEREYVEIERVSWKA